MTALTYEMANHLFSLDPETGILYWKNPVRKKFLGKPVGTVNNMGYVVFSTLGAMRSAHRVVWLLTHGEWPAHDIDHINGIRSDNRPCNLRDVPRNKNNQNIRKPYGSSTTGLLGAFRVKGRPGFQSSIHVDGKTVYIGYFKTAEEAHEAYMRAKRQLHPGFIQLQAMRNAA